MMEGGRLEERRVKVDATFRTGDLAATIADIRRLERLGLDGLFCAETAHDPFVSATLAAEHSSRVEIGTAIAVAFARNPMTVAMAAHDLQRYSNGRFVLGLGSQIKPHIEKRFSMPWSHPAPRMREFIAAMRAIWRSWNDGERLSFRGNFYQHTLMTPFFAPPASAYGPPKVFLAAVGEHMSSVAGNVADGLFVHGFSTEPYLREVTWPAVERGLVEDGRRRDAFEMSGLVFVVTGRDEQAVLEADRATRKQIAFYGSTPSYLPVLDHHGWGEVQRELNTLSKRGQWDAMGDLITDEMVDAFAVRGEPGEIGLAVRARYDGLLARCQPYLPYPVSDELFAEIAAGFA
jgi:probable F420-dependent oxidoreductase